MRDGGQDLAHDPHARGKASHQDLPAPMGVVNLTSLATCQHLSILTTRRCHPPSPPLAVNTGQCGSRFHITEQVGPLGIHAGKVRVQHGSGNISCETYVGCFCLQGHSSASLLLLLNGSPLFGSPCGYEFCVTVVALKWLV